MLRMKQLSRRQRKETSLQYLCAITWLDVFSLFPTAISNAITNEFVYLSINYFMRSDNERTSTQYNASIWLHPSDHTISIYYLSLISGDTKNLCVRYLVVEVESKIFFWHPDVSDSYRFLWRYTRSTVPSPRYDPPSHGLAQANRRSSSALSKSPDHQYVPTYLATFAAKIMLLVLTVMTIRYVPTLWMPKMYVVVVVQLLRQCQPWCQQPGRLTWYPR